MPSEWHVFKEGQRRQKRLACIFWPTQPAIGNGQSFWFRTSLGCKPRMLLRVILGWSEYSRWEEGWINCGVFFSTRSKAFSWHMLFWREESIHRCLGLANQSYRRTKLSKHLKYRSVPFPPSKASRGERDLENRNVSHIYRLLGPIALLIRELPSNSREAVEIKSNCENCSPSTARRGAS
jgi:hypothetical protein